MNNEPKILIVEDDEIKKSIYAAYFKRYCCSIDIVQSAERGLELFDEQEYDLLLVDVRLPQMNGFDFSRCIRLKKRGQDIPIIGVSAIAFFLVEDDFHSSGMNEYIDKPFTFSLIESLFGRYHLDLRLKNSVLM